MPMSGDRAMASRQIAILVGQEAAEIAERIRCLQRIAAFNRNLIGGDFDRTIIDKMEIAERCIHDVLMSARDLLDAQVIGIRDTRDAIESMRVLDRMDEQANEGDPPPGSWPVAGS